MKLIKAAIATLTLTGASAAMSAPVLNFENLITGSPDSLLRLGDQYASSGVLFENNGWVVNARSAGGLGNFINTPSGIAAAALFVDPTDPGDGTASLLARVKGGFQNSLTLSYASYQSELGVSLLDEKGKVLRTFLLDGVNQDSCSNTDLCNWNRDTKLSFQGTAYAVLFSGESGQAFLDNLSFGQDGGVAVPEPASLALLLAGFTAAGLARSRKRRDD
jgi:hypothetical protein